MAAAPETGLLVADPAVERVTQVGAPISVALEIGAESCAGYAPFIDDGTMALDAELLAEIGPLGAWDAMSMAALYCGNADLAHRAQVLARHIAGNTPFAHWFDMGCASTATTRGAFEDAIYWARKSAAVSPSFHPPLRYLIALYAHSGHMEKAVGIINKLKALEPDFSVDRLLGDDDYPVLALRRSRLLTPGMIDRLT